MALEHRLERQAQEVALTTRRSGSDRYPIDARPVQPVQQQHADQRGAGDSEPHQAQSARDESFRHGAITHPAFLAAFRERDHGPYPARLFRMTSGRLLKPMSPIPDTSQPSAPRSFRIVDSCEPSDCSMLLCANHITPPGVSNLSLAMRI